MNGLLILAVVGCAAVILLFASGQVATGVESVMCQFISGPRPDGWPRGVQERDIERPWGEYHRAEADPDAEPVIPVATQAVHARLGRPRRI
jgi:hypothetical protein